MKKLNKDFRRILEDTDVLSFPHHEKNFFLKKKLPTMDNIYLGDLALSYDYIKKQKNVIKRNYSNEPRFFFYSSFSKFSTIGKPLRCS